MKKHLIVLLLLLLPLSAASAVKLKSLYEVNLPVMSQQEDDRMAAAHDGLLQVLIKLSGDRSVESKPEIKAALKRSDYYVQEYSYLPPTSTESNYTIRLKFDKNDIRRLLKKSSVTFWGEKRPLILVWIVTADVNEDYQIMSSEETNNLLDAFKQESKKYGLPVIFPIMDMTDMGLVTTDDVASMNISALNLAGRRYAPDALLVGKVVDNKHELNSHWVLIKGGNSWEWTLSNANADLLFSNLLNEVRQTLAKQMALIVPPVTMAEDEVVS